MNQDALERAILADLFDELGEDEYHFWLTTGDVDFNIWKIETYGFEDEKRDIIRGANFLEITSESPLGQGGVLFEVRFTQPPRIVYGDESAELARLRAAGAALVPHVVEEDAFMDTLYCGACRVTMSDDEDFVHAPDCPTRAFAEGGE